MGSLSVITLLATGAFALGAQRVPMLSLTLTADCTSDVSVQSIRVRDTGKGDANDVLRVYVSDGEKRISRTATLRSSDHTAVIRFPKLTIRSCTTKNLTVRADISSNAVPNGEHRFSVEQDAIDAGTAIVTVSEETTVISTRYVTPASAANIAVTLLDPPAGSIRFGTHRPLLRLRVGVSGRHDATLAAVTLTNDGSARDGDLKNLVLESSQEEVTDTATSLTGNTVRLTFDPPLDMESGQERLFTLYGDIAASRRKTIKLMIDEPSDLEAFTQP